jgi:hypothetical protein
VNAHHAHALVNEHMRLDSLPPDIPEHLEPEIELEHDKVPEADLSNLWAEVWCTCPIIEVVDKPQTSLQGTNDAGSFISVRDSETDGTIDDDEIIYDPVTNGLSPEAQLRAQFRIDAVKNGT